MKSWKAILAACVIFAAGFVTGALAIRAWGRGQRATHAASPEMAAMPWLHQRSELMRRMERELNLSATQRERIEEVIAQSRERMRAIWQQVSPQANEETRAMRDQIREILTAAQGIRFEELIKRGPRRGEPGKREDAARKDTKADRDPRSPGKPEGPTPHSPTP